MATTASIPTWITGEEYDAERQRLRALGLGWDSPEYQALIRRVETRNQELWHKYGQPLLKEHSGRWAVLSVDGQVLLADDELEARRLSRERFGPGNAYTVRLTADRGRHRLGPRAR